MKKTFIKFISLFFFVVVLMSCCIVSVSAEDDPFLTSFGSIPIAYKSKYLTDDGYVYKYCFFVRIKDNYRFFYFGKDSNAYIDKLSYLYLTSSSIYFYDENLNSIELSYNFIDFSLSDGSFLASGDSRFSNYLYGAGFNYCYGGVNSIENFVDNIVYSDIPLKYGGLTVYDPSDNQDFFIKDFFETRIPDGPVINEDFAIGQIVSSAPLTPILGDPTFDGFKKFLIENEKYKELVKFGINCGADNLSSLVDLWTNHYSSLSDFTNALTQTFLNINAISQVSNIWNWFAQQFELYKQSLVTYELFEFKDDIFDDTSDYDTDGNFISSETAYFKLILGVLNTFRNDFNNSFSSLINYVSTINTNIVNLINSFQIFSNINYNLCLVYDKISAVGSDINTNFNQNMTAIGNAEANVVDTLLNLDFSDGRSCNYNEQNLFDKLEYLFIPQPVPEKYELSNIINNKFGFVKQIRDLNAYVYDLDFENDSLINTSDNLGLVLNGDYDLEVNSFNTSLALSTFDTDSRNAYLDDFYIDLSDNSFFGNIEVKIDVIDFSIYDKYKKYVDTIMIAICWGLYIRRLYKRMPLFLRTGIYRGNSEE